MLRAVARLFFAPFAVAMCFVSHTNVRLHVLLGSLPLSFPFLQRATDSFEKVTERRPSRSACSSSETVQRLQPHRSALLPSQASGEKRPDRPPIRRPFVRRTRSRQEIRGPSRILLARNRRVRRPMRAGQDRPSMASYRA